MSRLNVKHFMSQRIIKHVRTTALNIKDSSIALHNDSSYCLFAYQFFILTLFESRRTHDQNRPLHLLDRVDVLLHDSIDQGFIEAVCGGKDDVEVRVVDGDRPRLGERV